MSIIHISPAKANLSKNRLIRSVISAVQNSNSCRVIEFNEVNSIANFCRVNDKPTVVLEINHILVDFVNPTRSFREADSVAGRGIPAADRLQLTVVVMTGPVFQYRSVVYERVQISAHNSIIGLQRDAAWPYIYHSQVTYICMSDLVMDKFYFFPVRTTSLASR